MYRQLLRVSCSAMIAGVLGWMVASSQPSWAQSPSYLHTQGNQLLDVNGNQVILTGINWFGLETENYAPHGLWARNWESILDQIVELGFNTIRLPYSNQLFEPTSVPNGIDYTLNPDLNGLTGLEIMDKLIAGAGERGLMVILDRHRPDSHAQSELWYTPEYSEDRWIQDWVMLADRYAGNATVIGADLHNEPHGRATWGSGDPQTDWRLAAERAGNAILATNPDLLIIVQGVDQYQGDWYWWGGNLLGAREYPIRMDIPNRLVYSTHVYGPGVYPQAWFWDPAFPDNMPDIWDRHWGYINREGIAPVIVGEFGGRSVGEDKEGIWQRSLVSYMRENNLNYLYWTLNPNSGDTGGLLLDDWQNVDPAKQELLSGYQFSIIGIEQVGSEPSAQLPPPTAPISGTLRVRYRTANTGLQTRDSKPEFIVVNTGTVPVPMDRIELFYWFYDTSDQPYIFHCDWAKIGCANVAGDFHTTDNGAQYIRVHFKTGIEPLLPGHDSGEIKLRFNRADWSEYQQDDDFSFKPQVDYIDWERVTLYLDGQHVWGLELGTSASETPPELTPTPMPSPTTTVVEPTRPPLVTATTTNTPAEPTVESLTPTAPVLASGNSTTSNWDWLVFTAGLITFGIGLLALVKSRITTGLKREKDQK